MPISKAPPRCPVSKAPPGRSKSAIVPPDIGTDSRDWVSWLAEQARERKEKSLTPSEWLGPDPDEKGTTEKRKDDASPTDSPT